VLIIAFCHSRKIYIVFVFTTCMFVRAKTILVDNKKLSTNIFVVEQSFDLT